MQQKLDDYEYYRNYFIAHKDSSSPLVGIIDPQYGGLIQYIGFLDGMENDKKTLLLRLAPANPRIKSMDKEIETVKKNILQNIDNNRKALLKQQDSAKAHYEVAMRDFANFPELEAEYDSLSQLSDLKEKYYLEFLDKKTEFRNCFSRLCFQFCKT